MKIKQVYKDYNTPRNLQEHMLRVAALAKIITDNWSNEAIDKHSIIATCTLHDIAKPMTFDITKQAQYGMPQEDIDKLDALQQKIKQKYGDSEHKATVGIAKDSGMKDQAIRLLDNLEWEYIPKLVSNNDLESLIPIYCDMRIGPKGILEINKRFDDLIARKTSYFDNKYIQYGNNLEKLLQKNVQVDLNSITDSQLNSLFEELLDLEL